MIRRKLDTIRDVAEYQLCTGCGACAYISPNEIRMVDTLEYGRRPLVDPDEPRDPRSAEAMEGCPGIRLEHTFDPNDPELIPELTAGWGPVRQLWEGHAADPQIRFAGSSGGAATALALYCIEKLGFHGVLHVAARRDVPYLNETVMSCTREELLARTGSRYAPASPCDGLQMIEDAPGPCVFIGKPCDVAAVQKARKLRPTLDAKVGLTIAIFCAGTPTTAGTLALLTAMGVHDPSTLVSLRYRGNGWPGNTTATFRQNGKLETRELTYEQSWGEVLSRYKQWRCNLCPDHTGEFADVAVGDPWYCRPNPGDPGRSLIVARTSGSQRLVPSVFQAGYLEIQPAAPHRLPASQGNLLRARGSLWGRLWILLLVGCPAPYFPAPSLLNSWACLGFRSKLNSVLGTLKRVLRRSLYSRKPVVRYECGEPACVRGPEHLRGGQLCSR